LKRYRGCSVFYVGCIEYKGRGGVRVEAGARGAENMKVEGKRKRKRRLEIERKTVRTTDPTYGG
jgi:hypothetical protein